MSRYTELKWTDLIPIWNKGTIKTTVSHIKEENAIVNIHASYHGNKKQSGHLDLGSIDCQKGDRIRFNIHEVGPVQDETCILTGHLAINETDRQYTQWDIKLRRPSPGYIFNDPDRDLNPSISSLPEKTRVEQTDERGVPLAVIDGYGVRVPDAEIGDEIIITSVYITDGWDGAIYKGHFEYAENTSLAELSSQSQETKHAITTAKLGDPTKATVNRISGSGNAMATLNGEEVNLGPLECEPGIKTSVCPVKAGFAVCLQEEFWAENYRDQLNQMLPQTRLPDELPSPGNEPQTNPDAEKTEEQTGADSTQQSADTDLQTLRKQAVEEAEENPEPTTYQMQSSQEYTRSEAVKNYVKKRADGFCEGCGEPAPFKNSDGQPYLHAHHVHELSEGGPDTPETVIALCPNCHYRVHHGHDGGEYNEKLIEELANIEDVSIEKIQ